MVESFDIYCLYCHGFQQEERRLAARRGPGLTNQGKEWGQGFLFTFFLSRGRFVPCIIVGFVQKTKNTKKTSKKQKTSPKKVVQKIWVWVKLWLIFVYYQPALGSLVRHFIYFYLFVFLPF
jgi:hypothetical protein